MRPWREWDLEDWNARLLQHFFEKSQRDRGFPIVTLLVTKEELAKATGEAGSNPQEVQKHFVSTILQALPADMMLLDHAFTFPFNPDFALPVPPYVAHLIFTCLAASESSDELANEGSYRKRLNELARGKCPDKKLDRLKHLWERLGQWLVHPANAKIYRRLVLPDPGPHTRIGYTEGLAFPGRLDQRDLTEVLKNAGMVGSVLPPPGKVITVVARNLATFRKSFQEAFEEFRSTYHTATAGDDGEALVNHRFWSAVVESCLRGRTSDAVDEQTDRFELIASFNDEYAGLYLLSRSATLKTPDGFELEALPESTGPWIAALVSAANHSSGEAIAALFDGRLKMHWLRPIISQGFLPFVSADAGQYSLARSSASIALSTHALVRDELVGAVIGSFGGRIVDCAPPVVGWRVVESLRITTLAEDDSTELRNVWILQRQLAPRKIYISGGIRSDDGWLGFADAMPRVTVVGATSVFADYRGARLALARSKEGPWMLPLNDYHGVMQILAFNGEKPIAQMSLKFIPSPASEEYKTPANLHAFYSEGQCGAVILRLAADLSETDGQMDMGVLTGRVLLLGRNQGEFVVHDKDAAWKIVRGGGTNYVTLPDSPGAGEIAVAKADAQGLRRKWRTFVQQSIPIGDHAELPKRLAAARAQLKSGDDLPVENYPLHTAPSIYTRATSYPAEQTVLLAHALAGRGAAKRGIPFADWKALVCAFTGLPEKTRAYEKCAVEALTRCWQEAALIDVVTSASWSGRTIFPLKPTLALIKNGPVFCATLSGLCLDSTARRAREKAKELHIAVEDKNSSCRFVPTLSVYSSPEFDAIRALALSLGIPIRWVRVGQDIPGATHVEASNPRPSNYDTAFRFKNWSLNGKEHPTIAMTFYKRDNRPAFWSVEHLEIQRWSYSKNAARIYACRVAGVDPVRIRGDHEIVVEHAYLPLPYARYSAFAGPILPGPDNLLEGGEGHVYAFGTREFRDQVFALAKQ